MPATPTWLRRPAAAEAWTAERCFIVEIVNAADSPAASLARARVPPGVTTRLHALDGITERYIILEGTGRAEVDGIAAEVGPGDQVLIPPAAPQRISNIGREDLVFFCLCTPRFRPGAYRDLES